MYDDLKAEPSWFERQAVRDLKAGFHDLQISDLHCGRAFFLKRRLIILQHWILSFWAVA